MRLHKRQQKVKLSQQPKLMSRPMRFRRARRSLPRSRSARLEKHKMQKGIIVKLRLYKMHKSHRAMKV
eukprot:749829-Rhodomonas_salina.1